MTHEIVRDKKICGGKACLKGTRIRVIDIVERYKILKEKPEEIATAFEIPIQTVFVVLSYYYKHTAKIKEEIESDKEFVKKIRNGMKTLAYAT